MRRVADAAPIETFDRDVDRALSRGRRAPEAKLDLLLQLCFLFEELIDDPTAAITAYRDVLELDPRPAFQRRRMPPASPEAQGLDFGFAILDFDVKWRIQDGRFVVTDLQ